MIPAWLPETTLLAYFTGIAHIAAGLALITSILPRLAATLEALMLTLFVLLVHVPSVIESPVPEWASTQRVAWTALFWAGMLAASAWLITRPLHEQPWGWRRSR